MNARTARRRHSIVEILEARIAPAVVDFISGTLVYTAGGGVGNSVSLSISGANYSINDSQEPITLSTSAVNAGFTNANANTVLASNTTVLALDFRLGDLNDQFQVSGLTDPLVVDGQAGTADAIFITGAINPGGPLTFTTESLTVSQAVSGATTVNFTADSLAINAAVTASGRVTLAPQTAARLISLGAEVAGSLSLTDAELDRFTTPDVLQVGTTASGALTIGGALSLTNADTLSLQAGGNIQQTAPLATANLSVRTLGSGSGIDLNNSGNDVDTIAASCGGVLLIVDADDLVIGTVDGVAGLTMPDAGLGNPLGIIAGPVTQTSGAGIATQNLQLLGAGPYTLNDPANAVGSITGTVTGAVSYTDADALAVIGLTTTNSPVSLTALNGDLELINFVGGIGAGTGTVSLTVGGNGRLNVQTGAGVLGTGGVTFTADQMSIGGVVNAGAGIATLRPFESGTLVNLGGADSVNTLGLTDAELDFVTSGVLRVGSATAGNLTVSAPIDAANTSTLSLITGGSITMSSGITETNLRLSAGTTIDQPSGQNIVGTLAASAPNGVLFGNGTAPLLINVVDGVQGIVTTNAPVTVFANALAIQGEILAGTGRVLLHTNVPGTNINLGTATGGLDLTDVELDRIQAGVLEIKTNAGAINVSSAISPAQTNTLTLNGATISGAGSIAIANLRTETTAAVTLNGTNDVDTLAVNVGGSFSFADADGFTIGPVDDELGLRSTGPDQATINAGTNGVAFASGATFSVDINGTVPGTDHDQLAITGTVNLGGAMLTGTSGFTPAPGVELIIISNDGSDAISGTFAGLGEGAPVTLGGSIFQITYFGGDGNDVALTTPPPLTVSQINTKTVTFTDVDGDLVTVKSSIGAFAGDGSEFIGITTGPNSAGQLQRLVLGAAFTGASITITAKPGANGGNGFVNIGFLDATGVDLGAVSIAGDLGRIVAGTVGGDAKVPALKSLTVETMGMLGTSTQNPGGNTNTVLEGGLPKLSVKGDVRVSLTLNGVSDGKLGSATVGGSFTVANGGGSTIINASAGIGTLKIGGDIRGTDTADVKITTNGAIGTLSVGGSIVGMSAAAVQILAFGQIVAPTKGVDTALKTLNVVGSVEFAFIGLSAGNADASIGAITIGGDWIASTVIMGATIGADFAAGTADDAKAAGRDNPAIFSTIGSLTIKGQALGTAGDTTDMFGIVAERIGKATVGGRTFAFKTGTNEAFFAAPTLDGAGAEDPMFDFTIRELGSITPTVALGGENLVLSADSKTATFTDVDGDLVTVKRNVGTFGPSDFTITAAASGGGLLQSLIVNPAPNNVATNLSITAKVGPGGGNGFVNVGKIDADQTDLGIVVIGGEMQDLDVGDNGSNRVGLASLTVHSLGAVAGTAPNGDEINSSHGIGKIVVKTDIRNFHVFANNQDSGNLGSITIGGSVINSDIQSAANIGTVKIGGSFRDGGKIQATKRIGTITAGGDFIGATIEAFAQGAGPLKGLDVALSSFAVKGNVETTTVILGRNNNADASIGTISVGRSWLASSARAGVIAGTDTFTGTADDIKTVGAIDVVTRFSTIASILIKGQSLGTAGAGDSFGIVAERIVKAQIGAVKFAFISPTIGATNRDAFGAAPTGPGATGLVSDFFLREIAG